MPTVGTAKFDYTDKGMAAAEQYATETGMDIEYEETGETAMYKKIQKTGGSPYKMKGHTLPGIKQSPYKHPHPEHPHNKGLPKESKQEVKKEVIREARKVYKQQSQIKN